MFRFNNALDMNTSVPYPESLVDRNSTLRSTPSTSMLRAQSLYSLFAEQTPKRASTKSSKWIDMALISPRSNLRQSSRNMMDRMMTSSTNLDEISIAIPPLTVLDDPDEMQCVQTVHPNHSGDELDILYQKSFYVMNGGHRGHRWRETRRDFSNFYSFDEIADFKGAGTFGTVFQCRRVDEVSDSQSTIGSDDESGDDDEEEEEEESEDETSEAESR